MALMSEHCGAIMESDDKTNAGAAPGVSILKEIFPEHGKEPIKNDAILQQLLGSIATPARNSILRNQAAAKQQMQNLPCAPPSHAPTIPCGPPSHAPMLSVAPAMTPPPPSAAPAYQAPSAPPAFPQVNTFTNYREKLRAGGRGAFQRSIDAGFMPKSMKQDWNAAQAPSAHAQGFLPQQQMQNSQQTWNGDDGQQMWNGAGQMHGNGGWGVPASQPQMPMQHMYAQQVSPLEQQAMPSQQQDQMLMYQSQMPQQVQTAQMQMPQMQMPQMEMPQMQMPQMQMPQMQMQQMQQMEMPTPTASGDSTPADVDRCMAIINPQAGQFPYDKDLVALQLRAAAECQQCYED